MKLAVTPVLIGSASLAGRRWGQAVSGWLVGLPFTSGPVAFFLAIDYGVGFAAAATAGSVAGAIGEVAFVLAYASCALRWRWPVALVAGSVAFAMVASALQRIGPSLAVLVVTLVVVLGLALSLFSLKFAGLARWGPSPATSGGSPWGGDGGIATAPPPAWDLPARMIISTVLVVVFTGAAPVLGPRMSGALSSYPVYAGILTVFAHHIGGPRAGIQVLRGLLLGLFAFGGFFAVVGTLIERHGVAVAFLAAVPVALAIQGASLAVMLVLRGRAPSGGCSPVT